VESSTERERVALEDEDQVKVPPCRIFVSSLESHDRVGCRLPLCQIVAPANEHEQNSFDSRTVDRDSLPARPLPCPRRSNLPRATHSLISPKRCEEGLPPSDSVGPSRQTRWSQHLPPPPLSSPITSHSPSPSSLQASTCHWSSAFSCRRSSFTSQRSTICIEKPMACSCSLAALLPPS
jgi:hypothetical protein